MIKFVYFDLGKVLVDFSHQQMCEQMAAVAGKTADQVENLLFQNGFNEKADRGEFSADEFYSQFCDNLGVKPDFDRLVNAAADIFTVKNDVLRLVKRLHNVKTRMGILSNTCQIHWDFVTGNFGELIELFEATVLSFEVGQIKPESAIYQYAIDMADCIPDNIFFTDDRQDNVDGARKAGLDAVLFVDASDLEHQLHARHLI